MVAFVLCCGMCLTLWCPGKSEKNEWFKKNVGVGVENKCPLDVKIFQCFMSTVCGGLFVALTKSKGPCMFVSVFCSSNQSEYGVYSLLIAVFVRDGGKRYLSSSRTLSFILCHSNQNLLW